MSQFQTNKTNYIKYWQDLGFKEIPGVGLVPNSDSSLLFVNSGMFPLVPYLFGEPHPLGRKLCNIQRCIRTDSGDMEEIGDKRHTTCFHMLGDWSLGDFFKKEQIPWILDLYVNVFKLDVNRLYVSVFAGDDDSPRDDESIEFWKQAFAKYGITALFSENPADVQKNEKKNIKLGEIETEAFWKNEQTNEQYKIFPFPKKKNWWQRGSVKGEPGGPDSEMFFDLGKHAESYFEADMNVNSDNDRFIEVGNNVFMQFFLDENLKWKELPQKNVDFGGGMERVMMAQLNCETGAHDMFQNELFIPIIQDLEKLSGISYENSKVENPNSAQVKAFRIIADHLRAACLIIADGVLPSNKTQGYILRRFIRRLIVKSRDLGISKNFTGELARKLIVHYDMDQPQLIEQVDKVVKVLDDEETKFRNTLDLGLKEFDKLVKNEKDISAKSIFTLYESFGFPFEMSIELLRERKINLEFEKLESEIQEEKISHQSLSRSGADKIFKGGLADNSEIVTALHTTQHLLLAAIQKVLKSKDIHQRGSNITSERLRFDFNFDTKLTTEQLEKVENLVQSWIDMDLAIIRKDIPIAEAEKMGAEKEFGMKYPEIVSVYAIESKGETPISMEFCGGPHVLKTSQIATFGKFKILKEESSGSGIRRIKANLVK